MSAIRVRSGAASASPPTGLIPGARESRLSRYFLWWLGGLRHEPLPGGGVMSCPKVARIRGRSTLCHRVRGENIASKPSEEGHDGTADHALRDRITEP
jgi:hypothetical protein